MVSAEHVPEGWTAVERPPSLFRRFEFAAYAQTRGFLDRLAALSEQTGVFPDLGFGKTHVNVTVYGTGGGAPGDVEITFARHATALQTNGAAA